MPGSSPGMTTVEISAPLVGGQSTSLIVPGFRIESTISDFFSPAFTFASSAASSFRTCVEMLQRLVDAHPGHDHDAVLVADNDVAGIDRDAADHDRQPTVPGPVFAGELGVTPAEKHGMPTPMMPGVSRTSPSVTKAAAPLFFIMPRSKIADDRRLGEAVGLHQHDVAGLNARRACRRGRGNRPARPRRSSPRRRNSLPR